MNIKIKKKLKEIKLNEDFRQSIQDCLIDVSLIEWILFPIIIKMEIATVYFFIKLRFRWIPNMFNQLKFN